MSLKEGSGCWGLPISMKDGERLSLEQIRAFLGGSEEVGFKAADRRELYEWTERTLCAQEYARLGRSGKGLVRQYIAKVTGLSRAQVTRLIRQYAESGRFRSGGAGDGGSLRITTPPTSGCRRWWTRRTTR